VSAIVVRLSGFLGLIAAADLARLTNAAGAWLNGPDDWTSADLLRGLRNARIAAPGPLSSDRRGGAVAQNIGAQRSGFGELSPQSNRIFIVEFQAVEPG
jgi:hypothetical protein